ncbi:MAG TPA: hypothetical protein VNT20_00640 [Flavisolibacter sp.]|jgi:hypothetical protein|nr:hypothetical protein [Flavisolibacter sp.]
MTTIPLTRNTGKDFRLESSSVQVKMFIQNSPKEAEKEIAQWLKENDVIIHHIAQSQSEKNGSFVFVITLFYLQNN